MRRFAVIVIAGAVILGLLVETGVLRVQLDWGSREANAADLGDLLPFGKKKQAGSSEDLSAF